MTRANSVCDEVGHDVCNGDAEWCSQEASPGRRPLPPQGGGEEEFGGRVGRVCVGATGWWAGRLQGSELGRAASRDGGSLSCVGWGAPRGGPGRQGGVKSVCAARARSSEASWDRSIAGQEVDRGKWSWVYIGAGSGAGASCTRGRGAQVMVLRGVDKRGNGGDGRQSPVASGRGKGYCTGSRGTGWASGT